MSTNSNGATWASNFDKYFGFRGWDGSTGENDWEEYVDVKYKVIDNLNSLPQVEWGIEDHFLDQCHVGKETPYFWYLPEKDPMDFPTRLLPKALKDVVTETARVRHTSEGVVAGSIFALAFGILGRKLLFNYIADWEDTANNYVIIVGKKGSKKSPIEKTIFQTLVDIDDANASNHEKVINEYSIKYKIYEQKVKESLQTGKQISIEPPENQDSNNTL